MKLTRRESFLIRLAGIIALIALSYYLVILPQLEILINVRSELAVKTQEMESIKLDMQSVPELDEEINILVDNVTILSENFFPEPQLKKLIVIIDERLQASGVKADSLEFSQFTIVENPLIEESEQITQDKPQHYEDNSNEISTLPEMQSISIDIPFEGTFPQIMHFINLLESMNRHMVISNLEIDQGTNGSISGVINLEFYSLNKLFLDSRDHEFLDWSYNIPMGTDNPFRQYVD